MPTLKKVTILQRRLTHYRLSLFETLRESLAREGITLQLVYGQPSPDEEGKKDSGHLAWAKQVRNRYWKVGNKYLCWQPLPAEARDSDLIVITQENSLLSNYPLLLRRKQGGPKIAFWGHGANLQSASPNGLRERFKRWLSGKVDWWFAYTQMSVEIIASSGFPKHRITNLENAIDTCALADDLRSIQPEEVEALKNQLDWEGCQIGVFLGSLHTDKRLDFLFEAADQIHSKIPSFRLLIVGDGPLRDFTKSNADARPWCTWVGAKTGREKAQYLTLADVMLNPGLVGLGILDSFVAGLPMVTTDCGVHSPEIAYLQRGGNGLVTENTIRRYVEELIELIMDKEALRELSERCIESSKKFTTSNMSENFSGGIKKVVKDDWSANASVRKKK